MGTNTANKDAQLQIPGIDVEEDRIKGLMKRFPLPETRDLAEKFFRAKCVFNLKYKQDVDIIKVSLKNRNYEDDIWKMEGSIEFPADDQDAYDEKYVEVAQELYWQWLKLEKDKYSNDLPIDQQIE